MKLEKFTKEVDGQVVSSLIMYFVDLPSRRLAVIEEVFTKPEHRNKGYSTELLVKAMQRARKLQADCIELTVRQDSPHIRKFYEQWGFEDRMQVAMRCNLRNVQPWNPN